MKRQRDNQRSHLDIQSSTSSSNHTFQRSFKHVDGNWPSHVYIKIDSTAHLRAMAAQCIAHLQESDGEAIGFNELLVPENVHHLSLSRPFVLRSHQITAFVAYLAGRIKGTSPFPVVVSSHRMVLINDQHTRAFVGLPVRSGRTELLTQLVAAVDSALEAFNQPVYYSDPKFHISVASWNVVGLPAEAVSRIVALSSQEPVEDFSLKPFSKSITSNANDPTSHSDNNSNSDEEEDDDDDGDFRQHVVVYHSDAESDDDSSVAVSSHLFTRLTATTTTSNSTGNITSNDSSQKLLSEVRMMVNSIQCKIGNRLFVITIPDGSVDEIA